MKISVAMCTYEGERFLREQLASIAAQVRAPDELVVCDDRSSDSTPAIVREFAAGAPFSVRLHVNEQNLGSTKNFERAVTLCGGDLIALSDQDDVWLPSKLGRIEEVFLGEPRTGLVFSDAEVVDEELRPLGYRLWESVGFDAAQQGLVRSGRALDVLLSGSTVTGATMAFRSRYRNLVLEIPEDLALIHDGWIALMVSSVAGVTFIEEPLVKYRQHSRQQIGARRRKAAADENAAGLSGVRDAMRRRNFYDEIIETGSRVRRRLTERREEFGGGGGEALTKLEARLKHLNARANLPEGKLSRAGCVLRELLTRRYHLYSNGVYSAVKDLLA